MKNKHIIIPVVFSAILLFSGCTSDTNQPSNQESSDQNLDTSDLCGNAIGNGDEIVFGQVTPTEWNPDNPFRSLTVHPCLSLAQQANMSLEEYQDFVYGATLIDWKEESKLLHEIKAHLENHSDIRYVGPETDLWASTEGRIWIASDGKHNMPSGEVFTAPVETSVEGKIYFDVPFLQLGKVIEGVRLTFEKGEVVDFSAEKEELTLKEIIEIDEGSRRLGEMAIGTNRGIKQYTLNMLFDEKIGDTIHCALGRAYKDCNGVNDSAVHVDMIKTMKEGEITAGNEVIYSRGKYFREK